MIACARALLPALLLLAPGPALLEAGEVRITYPALERTLWRTMMTDGGRLYLQGDASSTCRYAFLQEPRVGVERDRLRIRLLFSGRAGTEVAGRCIGPGDTFDLYVSGVPSYSNGELLLADLKVEAPRTAYFRLVSGLVEGQLRERLRYPLAQGLDALAAQMSASAGARITVGALRIASVAAEVDALRLSFDLDLKVE